MTRPTGPGAGAVAYARFSPRRGGWRAGSWWAKAFLRAIEEAAYDPAQLAAGRALARSGHVGGLIVDAGSAVASVEDPHVASGFFSVRLDVPVLEPDGVAALGEVLAASPRHRDALLGGDLPHELVEHLEEAGVELLPYGEELAATCTCRSWHSACVHALGVMHQLAWLIDPDPLVLLHLRGLSRTALREGSPGRGEGSPGRAEGSPGRAEGSPGHDLDPVEVALEAVFRARSLLGDGQRDPSL